MVKDDIDYKDDDDLALRQFEEDMKQDREERMARLQQERWALNRKMVGIK